MTFFRQRIALLIVMGAIATLAQCLIGGVSTAHAYQYGNSYFENVGPGYSYTPNSSPYCAGASLVGDVIPNYTRPTDGCDFTGAVGERRMQQVTGLAPGQGDLRDKFFWVLYVDYHWGDAWERAGAAQVALSLLGYGFGSHVGDRTVTDAQWNDLHARLIAPDIEMLWSSPNCRSSYCLPGADFQYNTAGIVVNGKYDSIRVNNGSGMLVDAWVLRSRSNPAAVYATYEIECANGIGDIVGLPRSANWSINGQSYIQKSTDRTRSQGTITAAPGDTVNWFHDMRNNGPDDMDRTVYYNVDKTGFIGPSAWWNGDKRPTGNASGRVNELFVKDYAPGGSFTVKQLTQDDVGATMCQRIAWQDASSGARGAWGASNYACVQVPYNFTLTTKVDMPTTATSAGSLIGPINPYIKNAGPTKSYDGTAWQLSKFILPSGKPIPGATTSASTPCANYGNGCVSMSTGNGTYAPGQSLVGQIASYTVDDAPIGSRICFALSVNKYDQGQSDGKRWYHGAPACVVVGKKPTVQVWGGDVAARTNIDTSLTQKTNGVFGSWVEYGAFSVGLNSNFASGAGLAAKLPGSAMSSTSQGSWSKLTFANVDGSTPPNDRYGLYATSASSFRAMPNIAQYFAALSGGAPAFSGNTPSGGGNSFPTGGAVQVRTAGDVTLHKDTLPAGRSVVLISSGTVTIDGDLTYQDGPFASGSEIPQLVIIAKAINITGGVQNIDAWLVATDAADGTINTCSDKLPTDALTGNDCNQPLTIHGPVEARNLLLRRTYGSGTDNDSATPAEVIDMRADAYIWAQQVAAGAGKAKTVYTTELPPRF